MHRTKDFACPVVMPAYDSVCVICFAAIYDEGGPPYRVIAIYVPSLILHRVSVGLHDGKAQLSSRYGNCSEGLGIYPDSPVINIIKCSYMLIDV